MKRIFDKVHFLLALMCLCMVPLLPVRPSAQALENWPLGNVTLQTAIPDLSDLNHKPAGSLGHVVARDDQLFFADGTLARFWGANLQAYAIYHTDPPNIRAHAKRLSQLGFNLVRIHHHDSGWVQPNIFGENADSTTQLNADWLDKLDQWTAALKAEGIYLWLDMHVGRAFTAADGIEDFAELANGEASVDVRGYNYVSPSIERLMRDFQTAFLTHRNPYTGLTYAEDPAVMAVQLTNENDLTHHFANGLLPDKNVPRHSDTYMTLGVEFAREHGLDPDLIWRSWEPGPSKIFLSDLEHRFNDRMVAAIRETGFQGLISTTSHWGDMPVSGLPSQTRGTITDAHSYGWDGEIGFDPGERPGLLDWIAIAQIAGRPFSVSEWNIGSPMAEDRFIAPLRVAATAALQGWDAMMVYGYSQQSLNGPVFPENWSIANDPSMIGMMPAAAVLYRQGHVRQADRTYALCLDEDEFFGGPVSPVTSLGVRTVVEQSRLVTCMPDTPALPWLDPTDLSGTTAEILDPEMSYLQQNDGVIAADTGEFFREYRKGRFVVNTKASQIVAGQFHHEPVRTDDVEFYIDTPLAAIAVQGMGGQPVSQAQKILISITARAVPVDPQDVTFRIEPLKGTLRIRARPELTLKSVDPRAGDLSAAHVVEQGMHVIDLDKIKGSRWLYLE